MVDLAPPFSPDAVDDAAEVRRARPSFAEFCLRQPLGTFGLFLTPVFFVTIRWLTHRGAAPPRRECLLHPSHGHVQAPEHVGAGVGADGGNGHGI